MQLAAFDDPFPKTFFINANISQKFLT